jgi:hypothetical protein
MNMGEVGWGLARRARPAFPHTLREMRPVPSMAMGEERIQIWVHLGEPCSFLSSPMNMGEVGWGLALLIRRRFLGKI